MPSSVDAVPTAGPLSRGFVRQLRRFGARLGVWRSDSANLAHDIDDARNAIVEQIVPQCPRADADLLYNLVHSEHSANCARRCSVMLTPRSVPPQ